MPHDRFFVDSPLHPDTEVLLQGEEAHHLTRVMRNQPGDTVELVNGNNLLATATLLRTDKKGSWLKITSAEEIKPPPHALILCQAIPRLNRLETIVEKGTELGITALWLFPGQLSEKKELSPNQLHRLQSILISAMKQSGRLDLPSLILKPPLTEWTELPSRAYFGDIDPSAPPFLTTLHEHKPEDILFFVGPEAGFSPREETHLRHLGAQGVCLHRNILRTDTAPLAALSIISSAFLQKNQP